MKNEVDRTNFDEKPIVLCEAAGKLNGKMKTIETRSFLPTFEKLGKFKKSFKKASRIGLL